MYGLPEHQKQANCHTVSQRLSQLWGQKEKPVITYKMVTVEEYDPNNEFLASKFSCNRTIKDTMRVHKDFPGGK